jgi:hypothetical protein
MSNPIFNSFAPSGKVKINDVEYNYESWDIPGLELEFKDNQVLSWAWVYKITIKGKPTLMRVKYNAL